MVAKGSLSSLSWAEESNFLELPAQSFVLQPFEQESLTETINSVISDEIAARSRSNIRGGNTFVEGGFKTDFHPHDAVFVLMKHLLAGPVTSELYSVPVLAVNTDYEIGTLVSHSGHLYVCRLSGNSGTPIVLIPATNDQTQGTATFDYFSVSKPIYMETYTAGGDFPVGGLAFEKLVDGQASPFYWMFSGGRVNSLSITIGQEDLTNLDWNVMGILGKPSLASLTSAYAAHEATPFKGENCHLILKGHVVSGPPVSQPAQTGVITDFSSVTVGQVLSLGRVNVSSVSGVGLGHSTALIQNTHYTLDTATGTITVLAVPLIVLTGTFNTSYYFNTVEAQLFYFHPINVLSVNRYNSISVLQHTGVLGVDWNFENVNPGFSKVILYGTAGMICAPTEYIRITYNVAAYDDSWRFTFNCAATYTGSSLPTARPVIEASINVLNNFNPDCFVLGSRIRRDLPDGSRNVSGSFTTYFQDREEYDYFKSERPCFLTFMFLQGSSLVFLEMPETKLTGEAVPEIDGPGLFSSTLQFDAYKQAAPYDVRVRRFRFDDTGDRLTDESSNYLVDEDGRNLVG